MIIIIGTQLTEFKKGTAYGWTPSAWLTASEADRQDATKAPGITEKASAYIYEGNNSLLKTANSAIRNNLVFGVSNENMYWLASRGVDLVRDEVAFGMNLLSCSIVNACIGTFSSDGDSCGYAFGVRPVVALASDVSLTSVSTTDGITTWNIE